MKSTEVLKIKASSIVKYAFTTLLILYAGYYLIDEAFPFLNFNEETYGDYWIYRWPLIGHISGGIIAFVIGPFQFWNYFRNKYTKAHRSLGKIYLIAILIGSISSTSLAWTASNSVNFSWPFSLQILAIAWFTTAAMAYISIRKKRITQHKEWMIRSYIVTFGFANFRWLSDLDFVRQLMSTFAERGATLVWVSWVVPLLFAEVIMSWNKK